MLVPSARSALQNVVRTGAVVIAPLAVLAFYIALPESAPKQPSTTWVHQLGGVIPIFHLAH